MKQTWLFEFSTARAALCQSKYRASWRLGNDALLSLGCVPRLRAETLPDDLPFPLIERFESFGMKDGFPTHKVHCVLPTSDGNCGLARGKGLVVREDGKFRKIGVQEGLSHKWWCAWSKITRTGDLWIGTMRGLNRYSAGRITRVHPDQLRAAE